MNQVLLIIVILVILLNNQLCPSAKLGILLVAYYWNTTYSKKMIENANIVEITASSDAAAQIVLNKNCIGGPNSKTPCDNICKYDKDDPKIPGCCPGYELIDGNCIRKNNQYIQLINDDTKNKLVFKNSYTEIESDFTKPCVNGQCKVVIGQSKIKYSKIHSETNSENVMENNTENPYKLIPIIRGSDNQNLLKLNKFFTITIDIYIKTLQNCNIITILPNEKIDLIYTNLTLDIIKERENGIFKLVLDNKKNKIKFDIQKEKWIKIKIIQHMILKCSIEIEGENSPSIASFGKFILPPSYISNIVDKKNIFFNNFKVYNTSDTNIYNEKPIGNQYNEVKCDEVKCVNKNMCETKCNNDLMCKGYKYDQTTGCYHYQSESSIEPFSMLQPNIIENLSNVSEVKAPPAPRAFFKMNLQPDSQKQNVITYINDELNKKNITTENLNLLYKKLQLLKKGTLPNQEKTIDKLIEKRNELSTYNLQKAKEQKEIASWNFFNDVNGIKYDSNYTETTPIVCENKNVQIIDHHIAKFNGTDSYIKLNNPFTLPNEWTFTCFVQFKSLNNSSRIFDFGIKNNDSDTIPLYNICITNEYNTNRLCIGTRQSNIWKNMYVDDFIELNEKIHLAVSIKIDKKDYIINVYKNGILQDTVLENGTGSSKLSYPNNIINKPYNKCYFGKSNYDQDKYFYGELSNITIYNIIKSDEEIKNLYDNSNIEGFSNLSSSNIEGFSNLSSSNIEGFSLLQSNIIENLTPPSSTNDLDFSKNPIVISETIKDKTEDNILETELNILGTQLNDKNKNILKKIIQEQYLKKNNEQYITQTNAYLIAKNNIISILNSKLKIIKLDIPDIEWNNITKVETEKYYHHDMNGHSLPEYSDNDRKKDSAILKIFKYLNIKIPDQLYNYYNNKIKLIQLSTDYNRDKKSAELDECFAELEQFGIKKPDYTHLGCYLDDGNRDLKKLESKPHHKSNMNTCGEKCQNYKYIGLQYRGECWCGNTHESKYEQKSENDCNMNCKINNGEKCGGSWRNTVYKNNKYQAPQ